MHGLVFFSHFYWIMCAFRFIQIHVMMHYSSVDVAWGHYWVLHPCSFSWWETASLSLRPLCHFLSPFFLFLFLSGGRVKTWKRRWFILTDNCLYYFEYTTVSVVLRLYVIHLSLSVYRADLEWFNQGSFSTEAVPVLVPVLCFVWNLSFF